MWIVVGVVLGGWLVVVVVVPFRAEGTLLIRVAVLSLSQNGVPSPRGWWMVAGVAVRVLVCLPPSRKLATRLGRWAPCRLSVAFVSAAIHPVRPTLAYAGGVAVYTLACFVRSVVVSELAVSVAPFGAVGCLRSRCSSVNALAVAAAHAASASVSGEPVFGSLCGGVAYASVRRALRAGPSGR